MPKSKLRKRCHKKSTPAAKGRKDDIVFTRHPFSNIPRDILLKGLVEVGHKNTDDFPKQLKSVENILTSIDPILTIAMLTTYGLMVTIDDKGKVDSYKGDKFNQSHVELIQALTLKIAPENISFDFPIPDKIQELFELTETLSESYHLRRLSELGHDKPDEEKAIMLIQEELRLHTQVVRNWGYLNNAISITKRLLSPVDEIFTKKIGVSATELIDFFYFLIRRIELQLNNHHKKLSAAFRASTIEQMLDEYHKAFPNLVDSRKAMLQLAFDNEIPLEAMKAMMLSHSDLSLSDIYSFNIKTIADESKLDEESIQIALNQLSIKIGDLLESNSEHFF